MLSDCYADCPTRYSKRNSVTDFDLSSQSWIENEKVRERETEMTVQSGVTFHPYFENAFASSVAAVTILSR